MAALLGLCLVVLTGLEAHPKGTPCREKNHYVALDDLLLTAENIVIFSSGIEIHLNCVNKDAQGYYFNRGNITSWRCPVCKSTNTGAIANGCAHCTWIPDNEHSWD